MEREMYPVFTEVIEREVNVWGHNLNGWMNKTTN